MQQLKSIFDFYIFGNIHVALSAFCLTGITLVEINADNNMISWFVFFATILSYTFIKTYKIGEADYFSASWITSHKKILIVVNLIAIIFLGFFLFKISFKTIIALVPLILFTFFYIVPINGEKQNLRSIAGLKLVLIALTWAGTTVILPIVENDVSISNEVLILFAQRFFFIIALTIPFDIRDVNKDSIHLKTVPQTFGITGAKIIGIIALLFFLGFQFLKNGNSEYDNWITLLIFIISLLFLLFSKPDKHPYYTVFWIEGIPILWYGLLIL